MIIDLRVLGELRLHVLDLALVNLSPADGTSLLCGQLVLDDVAKAVFLGHAFHKPISMDANEVESVEALVDSHQIKSVRETLLSCRLLVVAEVFEANCASALDGVVVACQNLPHFLVQIVQNSCVILVLNSLVDELLLPVKRISQGNKFTYSSQIFWRSSSNWS